MIKDERTLSKTTRAFWALTPPPIAITALTKRLLPLLEEIGGEALRLTPPANMHITIKFLGDVESSTLLALRREMREVVSLLAPFPLCLRTLGAFPAWHNARVIWLGVESVPEEFLSLHRQCERIAAAQGYVPEKRRFQPHLTLGRARQHLRIEEDKLKKIPEFIGACFLVDSVELYASNLTPNGARYSLLERFPLTGGTGR